MISFEKFTTFVSPTPFRLFRNRPSPSSLQTPKCNTDGPNPVNHLQLGFTSIAETTVPITVPFTNPIPSYLAHHIYYQNGPAIYQVPHRDGSMWKADHWFDAIGIVHAFRFDSNLTHLHYRSRNNNHHVVEAIRSTLPSEYVDPRVGTTTSLSWLQKLQRLRPFTRNPNTGKIPYNNVVSLQSIPGKGSLNARTDVNSAQTLDPITLEPTDTFSFEDFDPRLRGDVSCAHGIYDQDNHEYFNFVYKVTGPKVEYKVFRISSEGQADVLASFQHHPNYIHSFALTQNYVIMVLWPAQYDLFKLLKTKSITESIRFPPGVPTKFVVISRIHANVVATYEHDQFFSFHVINAYEHDDDIFIDLAFYDDPGILGDLHIDNIISGGKIASAKPVRFNLPNLSKAVATRKNERMVAEARQLANIDIELASVSPQQYAKPYQYMYGVSDGDSDNFHGDIVKLNLDSGEILRWRSPSLLTNEPIFAPDPNGTHEDDGSLLVVSLDVTTETSSLVVIDARTMQEITRAQLPTHIPFAFHGSLLQVPIKEE